MMVCIITPLLFVLVMEILRSALVNTDKITSPSMKAFIDDVTSHRIQITHGTTGVPPTGALQIAGGRTIGFIPFPRVLVLCEMQSVSSRI